MPKDNERPGLEHYMNIVEQSHEKTASVKPGQVKSSLLEKLAAELEPKPGDMAASMPESESQVVPTSSAAAAAAAASASADAQGNVKPAESSVAGANPAVVSATEAVAVPQIEASGPGSAAEQNAGEIAAPVKPNEGLTISAGDGKVTYANNFSKEPGAVAAAAEPTGKSSDEVEKSADFKRAQEIGATMADAYIEQLEKRAQGNMYEEALAYLNEHSMLDGYTIKDQG